MGNLFGVVPGTQQHDNIDINYTTIRARRHPTLNKMIFLFFTRSLRPDDIFSLAADEFEVQLESKSVQRKVPQSAQFTHLVGEGAQVHVTTHIQRVQAFQQADLRWDLNRDDMTVSRAISHEILSCDDSAEKFSIFPSPQ